MKKFLVLLFDVFIAMLLFVAGHELHKLGNAPNWLFTIFLAPMMLWGVVRSPDVRPKFPQALLFVLALTGITALSAAIRPLSLQLGLPPDFPMIIVGMIFVWQISRIVQARQIQ